MCLIIFWTTHTDCIAYPDMFILVEWFGFNQESILNEDAQKKYNLL